MRKKLETNCGS